MPQPEVRLESIPLEHLQPGPWQPRGSFDIRSLDELAASIAKHGVLTPLRVVQAADQDYLIVMGERRWRAAQLAGLADVPCLVSRNEEVRLGELAVVDNIQRVQLSLSDEVRAVVFLQDSGLNQREIAKSLGKSQTWVSQRGQLAKLPRIVIERVERGFLSLSSALALRGFSDEAGLIEACLEDSGQELRKRFGSYFPPVGISRFEAVKHVLERKREEERWRSRMGLDGHRVLLGEAETRRFIALPLGSELSRLHQHQGLNCEAWAWVNGRAVRFCTDPQRLRSVQIDTRHAASGLDASEHQRLLELEASRDYAMTRWLGSGSYSPGAELESLARERIRTIGLIDETAIRRLGSWLSPEEQSEYGAKILDREVEAADRNRVIQLWFALEVAHSSSHAIAPEWIKPWLMSIGSADTSSGVGIA